MRTRQDVKDDVLIYLNDFASDFDVDAITNDLTDLLWFDEHGGYATIDTIDIDVFNDILQSHDISDDEFKMAGKIAQESAEYIAEQVVDYVKKNLNSWIDAGMGDVEIDDEVVKAIEDIGAPIDDDRFGEVMELVISALEDEGLLTESKYVYQAGRTAAFIAGYMAGCVGNQIHGQCVRSRQHR